MINICIDILRLYNKIIGITKEESLNDDRWLIFENNYDINDMNKMQDYGNANECSI